jgi:hypothetical protein
MVAIRAAASPATASERVRRAPASPRDLEVERYAAIDDSTFSGLLEP